MRILFCGGKTWGRDALQVLLAETGKNDAHIIVGVVVNNSEFDAPVYSASVYDIAIAHKLPIFAPQTPAQITDAIRQTKPDLIISVFYDRLFSAADLALAPQGGINLHMGDTSHYRGCYATLHALLGGDKEFGVTLHHMIKAVDGGDVIDKTVWPIDKKTTGYDLYMQAKVNGIQLFTKNLAAILNGQARRQAPDDTAAKHFPRVLPQKHFSEREITDNPQKFLDTVRAFDFYGFEGASFTIGEENYVVFNKNHIEGATWNKSLPAHKQPGNGERK